MAHCPGCHVLALDVVRTWSFDRPTVTVSQPPLLDSIDLLDGRLQDLTNRDLSVRRSSSSQNRGPPSPTLRKNLALLRRSSVIIDMDIPSFPPTRASSPPLGTVEEAVNGTLNGFAEHLKEDGGERRGRSPKEALQSPVVGDAEARKAALGSLMKSAKKDVVVPEFDMSSFGF